MNLTPTTKESQELFDDSWWTSFHNNYSGDIRNWISNNVDWSLFNGSLDIDDIEQDVYVRLLQDNCKALRKFNASSDFKTYLYRITQNTILNAVRTPRNRQSIAPMVGGFVDNDKIEDILDDLDAEREFLMIYDGDFPDIGED